MEPFIVSARKYRPETFEDVVGQSAITQTLERAIENNHLAQALLFTGPRGVGKTTCARILAKKINHESGDFDPDEDFAFNIFELDAASNNGVDHIRSIVDQVRIPPQVGKYKVYIIDEVHMLSNAAFNAFLKTLEEPPAHAIFILATTEKHKIIPTILSRCQIFDFKRITVSAMRKHLKRIAEKEGIIADEDALQIIAQKADGALRDSLSIFDRVVSFSGKNLTVEAVTQNLNVLDRETYFKITDLILDGHIAQLLVDFNEILAKGFDGQHFIAGLANHFRDLMVCKDERTIKLLEYGEQTKVKYVEQARKTDLSFLRTAIEIANTTDFNYRASRNQRLSVELALMQLASILQPDTEKKKSEPSINDPDHRPIVKQEAAIAETSVPSVGSVEQSQKQESSANYQASKFEDQTNQPSVAKKADAEQTFDQSAPNPVQENIAAKESSSVDPLEEKRLALADRAKKKTSAFSLASHEKQKQKEQEEQKKVVQKKELPTEEFSQEQLDLVWQKYIHHLEGRGYKILAGILRVDKPKLKENSIIHLVFPNQSMKSDLEKSQGMVLDFIKRELNNYSIEFNIEVNEKVTKKYAYTDQEKYAKLVEKNPAIETLRKTFDLGF
jgi:DNA polymerase-3 subunit gamma/tau